MNFDKLQELWKRFPGKRGKADKYSEEEILQILKNRADLSLKRLNRSLYFEVIMTFIALLFIVIYLSQLGNILFFQLAQVLIILLITLYFVFIGWIYHKLNNVSIIITDLRQSLESKVRLLTRFINSYFWINMLVAPIIFPLAIFTGYFAGSQEPDGSFIPFLNFPYSKWLFLFVISFLLVATFYPFLRWYINKLYGKHVKELEECLKEIANTDEN